MATAASGTVALTKGGSSAAVLTPLFGGGGMQKKRRGERMEIEVERQEASVTGIMSAVEFAALELSECTTQVSRGA